MNKNKTKLMENEEIEVIDSEIINIDTTIINEDETAEDDVEVEESSEDIENLRKELETLKHQKEHWKKKALESNKSKTEKPISKINAELSTMDIIALSKADIPNEDIEEVLEYAKFKKISIAEALKSSVVKATLADKSEIRKSAEATNTGNTRRGNSRTSDTEVLSNARKGILPKENDDDAIARLAKIR